MPNTPPSGDQSSRNRREVLGRGGEYPHGRQLSGHGSRLVESWGGRALAFSNAVALQGRSRAPAEKMPWS